MHRHFVRVGSKCQLGIVASLFRTGRIVVVLVFDVVLVEDVEQMAMDAVAVDQHDRDAGLHAVHELRNEPHVA